MQKSGSIFLGKWLGFPVYLHFSWLIMMGFILFLQPAYFGVWLCLFGIILLHEFGHCIAAKYYNWKVHDITLYPIGGAARMEIAPRPWEEIVVGFCGPLVNILLMPIVQTIGPPISTINLAILIFNLLPLFPLDGGRITRGFMELIMRDRQKSAFWATRVSQVGWVGMFILAIYIHHMMLAFIAVIMFVAAQAELVNEKFRSEQNFIELSAETLKELDQRIARYNKDFE